jgi:polyisoprenoid-binding protein YceI
MTPKKRRLFIGLGIVTLMVVGAGIYWIFIRETEPKDNILTFSTPIPEAQIYRVDSQQSSLAFTIQTSLGDIDGTLAITGERFSLTPDAGQWRLSGDMKMDGQTMETGNGLINAALKAGMKVDQHPFGVFVGQSNELLPDLNAQNQPVTMVGRLEISGVVRDFSIPAVMSVADGVLTMTAETTVDLALFEVDFPSAIASSEMSARITTVAYRVENMPAIAESATVESQSTEEAGE